jgi:hypothetical protein
VDFDPTEELTALGEAVPGPAKALGRAREIDKTASRLRLDLVARRVLERHLWWD